MSNVSEGLNSSHSVQVKMEDGVTVREDGERL